jgi:hypothetical protein
MLRAQYTPDFVVADHYVLRNTTSWGLRISPQHYMQKNASDTGRSYISLDFVFNFCGADRFLCTPAFFHKRYRYLYTGSVFKKQSSMF